MALHTLRLTTLQETLNNKALREALDLLPSVEGNTSTREALYKLRTVRQYDWLVRVQLSTIGDLVLRRTGAVAKS